MEVFRSSGDVAEEESSSTFEPQWGTSRNDKNENEDKV